MSDRNIKDTLERIYKAKKDFHSKQSKLSIEEKVKIIIKLQKLHNERYPEDQKLVWKLED